MDIRLYYGDITYYCTVMRIYVTIISLLFHHYNTEAGQAPDRPPDLPEGWCSNEYGSPTRSTGECICKRFCIGRACRREHGLAFYKYSDCPECQCVGENPDSTTNDAPMITAQYSLSQHGNDPEFNPDNEGEFDDDTFFLSYWLEENFRAIFAIVVSVFVAGIAMLFLVHDTTYSSKSGRPQKEEGAKSVDMSDTSKDKNE